MITTAHPRANSVLGPAGTNFLLSPARAEKIAFVTAAEVGATSAPAAAEQGAARRLDIGETGENVPQREDRVSVYGMGHVCRTVMEVVVGSKIPHQVRMEKRARGRKIRKYMPVVVKWSDKLARELSNTLSLPLTKAETQSLISPPGVERGLLLYDSFDLPITTTAETETNEGSTKRRTARSLSRSSGRSRFTATTVCMFSG